MDQVRPGGCNCGRVRFTVSGPPIRTGLCHCTVCRKETGGPFMAFGVWDAADVESSGETASWILSTDHRHFCPSCGSPVFGTHDEDSEVEVRLGALDAAPGDLLPQYELWIDRRETWLAAVPGAAQHRGNRPTT